MCIIQVMHRLKEADAFSVKKNEKPMLGSVLYAQRFEFS
jgi:hypothetical protein